MPNNTKRELLEKAYTNWNSVLDEYFDATKDDKLKFDAASDLLLWREHRLSVKFTTVISANITKGSLCYCRIQ